MQGRRIRGEPAKQVAIDVLRAGDAHHVDRRVAVEHLDEAPARRPGALERCGVRRVELDRLEDSLAYRGVKATLSRAAG